jgi:hypothetical protein
MESGNILSRGMKREEQTVSFSEGCEFFYLYILDFSCHRCFKVFERNKIKYYRIASLIQDFMAVSIICVGLLKSKLCDKILYKRRWCLLIERLYKFT